MSTVLTDADLERFWSKVQRAGPDQCWPWLGNRLQSGYGRIGLSGTTYRAHRLAYTLMVGPLSNNDHHLDHRCHTEDIECPGGNTCPHRACCNPGHLQPTTLVENVMAGRSEAARNARKTHCKYGHEFTPENTQATRGTARRCRRCAGLTGTGNWESLKTHCPQGHAYDEANTWISPKGSRACKACNRAKALVRYHARKNGL